jgi:potassium-transporting ATPase KdpC subunit
VVRHIKASVRLLILATLLFGGVYPLCVWVIGRLFFPDAAEACKVTLHGRTVGLRYVGQSFSLPAYFWSRPSAIPKEFLPLLVSKSSNLSWSSTALRATVEQRARALKGAVADPLFSVPDDMVMASASGLDPQISLKAALFQVPRVAAARGVSEDELRALVLHVEEESLFGLFPRSVNVLRLNCELDHHYPF